MKLYYTEDSAPCRIIILLANVLNIELEMILVSLEEKETHTDSYLQMNPQHVVPTLVDDDGYIIWESRVIAKYLVQKYAKSDDLYPKDFYTRLEIDKILHFDLGTIYPRTRDYFVSVIVSGKFNPAKKLKIDDAMNILEEILRRNKTQFVVGGKLSIADISLLPTITSLEVMDYDFSNYPNIVLWSTTIKALIPDYETVGVNGELAVKKTVDACLK